MKKKKVFKHNYVLLYLLPICIAIPWALSSMTYDIEICNKGAESTVYTSVAYFDPIENQWIGKGWFPTEKDKCEVLVKHVYPPVYVYAESTDGQYVWGDKSAKDQGLFCIHDAAPFEYKQNECQKEGVRWQQFRKLPTPLFGGTLTWSLKIPEFTQDTWDDI